MAQPIKGAGKFVGWITNGGKAIITKIIQVWCITSGAGINIKTQHIFAGKHSVISYTLQGVVAGCAIVSWGTQFGNDGVFNPAHRQRGGVG